MYIYMYKQQTSCVVPLQWRFWWRTSRCACGGLPLCWTEPRSQLPRRSLMVPEVACRLLIFRLPWCSTCEVENSARVTVSFPFQSQKRGMGMRFAIEDIVHVIVTLLVYDVISRFKCNEIWRTSTSTIEKHRSLVACLERRWVLKAWSEFKLRYYSY